LKINKIDDISSEGDRTNPWSPILSRIRILCNFLSHSR
jgi:hypothetical protein